MAEDTHVFFKGDMLQFAAITDEHMRVLQDGSFCLIIPKRDFLSWL